MKDRDKQSVVQWGEHNESSLNKENSARTNAYVLEQQYESAYNYKVD